MATPKPKLQPVPRHEEDGFDGQASAARVAAGIGGLVKELRSDPTVAAVIAYARAEKLSRSELGELLDGCTAWQRVAPTLRRVTLTALAPLARSKAPGSDDDTTDNAGLRQLLQRDRGWRSAPLEERVRALTMLAAALEVEDRATWPDPPTKAPGTWTVDGKGMGVSAADFTRVVYADWIEKGFTRAWLYELDPPLYRALALQISRDKDGDYSDLPDSNLDVDALLKRLGGLLSEDELRRAGLAIEARRQRAKKRAEK